MGVILVKEICRVCPGFVGAFGVSLGLGAATILSRGTLAQKERWVPEPRDAREDRGLGADRARTPAPTRSAR